MLNDSDIKISVVVPVYQEENNIVPFLQRVEPVLEGLGNYEILFCMDPCPDSTEEVVRKQIERNSKISLMVFSRRFGQPTATMAGILKCRGKTCVVIDVDLQDPPELIRDLYCQLDEGYEVVYAKRSSRKGETLLKSVISYVGYKVINAISDVEIPRNTGDFRIITRRVIEELRKYKETHGFLRGMVALVGFKQTYIEYDRDARNLGEGHYNRYLGSLKIGVNGLVGFSNFLLSISFLAGVMMAVLSLILICYMVVTKLFLGWLYPMGIPTIIILILIMGSFQFISIGILGQYIGRIYDEVKGRPRFTIDRTINFPNED